jgi:hypothetical protein
VRVHHDGERVRLQIFTTAYRKVNDSEYPGLSAGVHKLGLPLKDAKGKVLSNGLYYIRVSNAEGSAIGKLLILK